MAEETGTIIRDISGQTSSKTFVIPGRQTSIQATNLEQDTGYAATAYYTDSAGKTIYSENEVQFKTLVDPKNDYMYLENLYDGENTFTLTKTWTPSSTDLSYRINADGDWNLFDLTKSSQTVTLQKGEKIYFRSSTGFSKDASNYFTLNMSQSCGAGGNIASIFDYEKMDSFTSIPDYGCCCMFDGCSSLTTAPDFSNVTRIGKYGLTAAFYDCSSLTTAPNLSNVTSIGNYGLNNAFRSCSSLTTAPNLSNVTSVDEGGLNNAFRNCSSLTTAPNLSNVTSIGVKGLYEAFRSCSSLTTAPDLSNVTSIGNSVLYDTFYYCSSLTTAPDLSNVTSIGNYGLYEAFRGCSSLTTAPNLSNVTSIGNYGLNDAFSGCTSLTTAPDLSNVKSIGNKGLTYAFRSCSKLEHVTAPNVSTWDATKTENWLLNVSATGTFLKPKELTIPTGTDGIPTGWTVEEY